MTMFQMFLFTRVDRLVDIFAVCLVISICVFIASTFFFVFFHAGDGDDDEKRITKWFFFLSLPFFLFSLAGYTLIPSQKELAAIIVVPKILSAENVDKIRQIGEDGVDIVKLATEYTKGVLENKTK